MSKAHSKHLFPYSPINLLTFKKAAFTLAEGATHVDMSDNIRRVAFTLAEVLITLAIIGVVAAMTIPTRGLSGKNYCNKIKKILQYIFTSIPISNAGKRNNRSVGA